MLVIQILFFASGTILLVWVSRPAFRDVRSHGFYRFFAWELILGLFVLNMDRWFRDPFSLRQILAWLLLGISLILVLHASHMFRQAGGLDRERRDETLVGIEKTTTLVSSGIYRYIRHPFYSSLWFLAWGIFLKHVTLLSGFLIFAVTVFLFLTARREEQENIVYFGDEYRNYMETTRRFIPFLF